MAAAALQNTVAATLTDNAFFADLARSVANDGNPDTAATWLWTMLDTGEGPLRTFDDYALAVEQLARTWPVVRLACDMFSTDPAPIARFVAERIPAAMAEESAHWRLWSEPVTAALVFADRAHDLAGLFHAGLKPNGSKDPYALRRTAKQFIQASVLSAHLHLKGE